MLNKRNESFDLFRKEYIKRNCIVKSKKRHELFILARIGIWNDEFRKRKGFVPFSIYLNQKHIDELSKCDTSVQFEYRYRTDGMGFKLFPSSVCGIKIETKKNWVNPEFELTMEVIKSKGVKRAIKDLRELKEKNA